MKKSNILFEGVGRTHIDDGAEGNGPSALGNFPVNSNPRDEEIGVTKGFTFCFS
jgi:hypothetical protein